MGTVAALPRKVAVTRKVREQPRRLIPLGLVAIALLAWTGYRAWAARQPYTWAGTVEARDIAVGSRVGGRVKEVLVREGERVEPGQPLMILEEGDLPAQRLQAEGQLLQAQAALDKLRGPGLTRGTGSLAEQVARARAELTAAQVGLDKAELDARRARTLFQQQVNTRAELDTAEASLRQARAERDARRFRLQELEQGTDADVRAQQGLVDTARGRLEAINVAQGELTIRAPVASRVESLDLRPGDLLAPNATAATLVEDDQVYVRIFIPETHLGRLQPGSELPVHVDSFPERTFTGVVENIATQGEYTPRNLQTPDERASQVFATRIGLRQNGQHPLRAGMAAYVTVPK
ncbi:HlyD family secretion protein [Archangium lansingense]|uniref:HlyD family efflux transporter periplasmic adaptor subunit n=1 Tax=Archangium lansingense TaxID=2995310 RepID=A0ABT4A8N9_9BACT|nr:HlyD family efflux transporter periplasmic adaptor subunit [Archangium lansinium]MCY1077980.1 HlyD family efflux transporter periplasmic adaptor subunit [Archangium lansinium]